MKWILTLLLLIPTLLFSQRIEQIDGKYRARIEYSVTGKGVDYIFNNAKSWLEIEFQKSKMNNVTIYANSKKLSGTVYNKKLSFNIEIICSDGSFVTKFSDFYLNKNSLKEKDIKKVNKYLYELSGRMQKYIRYNDL